ncbi:uncharacterized protein LOC133828957 [Humulus lupulus]|uniref:uncharacterized protein LOC133828957 n=1 Tax=Humulus lupulus TaxID=3486 RepID=UPI002B4015B2|nr:uncharacterized protein LOC133828957 [Humulus lupulus]
MTYDIFGSLNEILHEDPKSGTTDNADEDALTKLFGNPKSGRLIGHGRGVTRSKVCGKVTPSKGQSRNVPQSNNIQSPKSIALEKRHNFTEGKNACYLLDWADVIVVEGHWDSSDPKIIVHGKPLGPDFMRVWVDVDIVPESYLFHPNNAMLTIQEAVGSTVA